MPSSTPPTLIFQFFPYSAPIMGRKKRTDPPTTGESSGSQEAGSGAGRGAHHTPQGGEYQGGGAARGPATPYPPYGGRGGGPMTPQPHYGGRGGGPMAPPAQYGGRGGGGGRGGYQQRGGMVHQQSGGPPTEYQARGYQPREGMASQQSGGGVLESGGRRRGGGSGGVAGGRGSGGSSRPSEPELHQASQAPFQAAYPTQQIPSGKESLTEASSSSRLPEISGVAQQLRQISIPSEGTSSQAIQPVASAAASSKSMRFPLRPGKGNTGIKCMVKANHFIAELPDKDLHQYDVSLPYAAGYTCNWVTDKLMHLMFV